MQSAISTTAILILALLSGALAPLSFSPVDIWPLGILSIVCYYLLLIRQDKNGFITGWLYGIGFFGMGASWIFVSMKVYGNTSIILSLAITLLFICFLALLFGVQGWLFKRLFIRNFAVFQFAAIWVIFEWVRGWIFTGFPWLYMGYAHIDTVLSGFAPISGIFSISFVVAFSGAAIANYLDNMEKIKDPQNNKTIKSIREKLKGSTNIWITLMLWLSGALLTQFDWVTEKPDEQFSVGIVQANIQQEIKFNSEHILNSLRTYETLSEPLWENDVVIWSETSIPLYYQRADSIINYFDNLAASHDSALITGILYRENDQSFNSITSLGDGNGIYHKQKVVPFGEYIPFYDLLKSIFLVFDLPMSVIMPGPENQSDLTAAGYQVSPFICYEIVYPDFVRKSSIDADFLVTVSNDTWFGASFGPHQHLQMAAMRALENGRYLVRGTSNGISAIIDEKGNVLARTQQFTEEVLQGEIKIFQGRTIFSRYGSWPILAVCFILLFAGTFKIFKRRVIS